MIFSTAARSPNWNRTASGPTASNTTPTFAISQLRQKHLVAEDEPLVIIKQSDRDEETRLSAKFPARGAKGRPPSASARPAKSASVQRASHTIDVANVYGTDLPDPFQARLDEAAEGFGLGLGSKIARITFAELAANPNYQYDDQATHESKTRLKAPLDRVRPSNSSAADPKSFPAGPRSATVITNCSIRKTTPITIR